MTWTCPKCGKPNLMEQRTCNNCGTSRPAGLHHIPAMPGAVAHKQTNTTPKK